MMRSVRLFCTSALVRLSSPAAANVHRRLQPQVERLRERYVELTDRKVLSKEDGREFKRLELLMQMVGEREVLEQQLNDVKVLKSDTDVELAALAADEERELNHALRDNTLAQVKHLMQHETSERMQQSVILEIRAGTGGDEAMLFANELYAMYTKLCIRRKWRMRELAMTESQRGGIREAVVRVQGKDVGLLQVEAGVHRVQRVPETETQGRIHTSTATVLVLSDQVDEKVEVKESDVRVDVFRASGAGGQHVNRTESAVRVTHEPTGLTATCQEERSQLRNKALAMEALKLRVALQKQREVRESRVRERREQVGAVMGERSDRIRTYNFAQRRVTDHRIVVDEGLKELGVDLEGKNVRLDDVLNGELDELMNAVQNARQLQALAELLQLQHV